ncbi:MAG: hypothetical protein H6814_00395 [Phycisphaeraceae bacterium]|nr:hypothetical protein [Phycisphaeraceae bacterium]
MRLTRFPYVICTAMICLLLVAQYAIGADRRNSGSDDNSGSDTSTPETPQTPSGDQCLYYTTFAGASADEIVLPDIIIDGQGAIMVYQHNFGIYPSISLEGEVTNGGLPQNVDIRDHIRQLESDIDRLIPEGFSGYVLIDYEEWTPFWEDTAGRYRTAAIEQVRQAKPNWDDAKVERKARKDFEKAAKKYFQRTLDKCHQKRPDAKFGLWSYPKARFRDNNARWLWNRHDAFFPAIYMYGMLVPDGVEPGDGEVPESEWVEDRLVGRVAYARELAGDNRDVLAVMRPWYSGNNTNPDIQHESLTASDLTMCMERPFDFGADGVVIWNNIPQTGLAAAFQDQMDYEIAPEIRRVLTLFGLPTDGVENPTRPEDSPPDDVEGLDVNNQEEANNNIRP